MSLFTERLKKLMNENNVSQKDLAIKSKISEASISRYLNGTLEPRIDILVNISKVFGVKTSYLLGEDYIEDNLTPIEQVCTVVTRNKNKLNAEEKAKIVQVLFGEK